MVLKLNLMAYKTAITRKEHFNAAHRLHNPNWSDEKNREVFGKCNNPNYHGHNYNLEVKVIGYANEETGYVVDAKILKNLIRTHVVEKFDHQNLNLDTEEFKNVNPTAENIARVIFETLRRELSDELELKIKLYETERNVVEYPAD